MTTLQREIYDKVNESESISSLALSSFLYGLTLVGIGVFLYSYPVVFYTFIAITLIIMLGGNKLISKIVKTYKFIRNLHKI